MNYSNHRVTIFIIDMHVTIITLDSHRFARPKCTRSWFRFENNTVYTLEIGMVPIERIGTIFVPNCNIVEWFLRTPDGRMVDNRGNNFTLFIAAHRPPNYGIFNLFYFFPCFRSLSWSSAERNPKEPANILIIMPGKAFPLPSWYNTTAYRVTVSVLPVT